MPLDRILDAKSVAIVGASKSEIKRGFQAIRTLREEYEGRIYPVNPKENRILGLQCYANVSDIEGPVDLVLITTPARTIPDILDDCGKKKVKGAVIIAGGFGEMGGEGTKLEKKVVAAAIRNGIRLIGPNTSGMMNVKTGMNLVGLRDVPKGNIALLSQSGNMALTLITEARLKSRRGFSYYVGVGNEADIKFHEYLKFFRKDPDTKVILLYVEGMRMGREFLQQSYTTTIRKPIVLLKSGRSDTGMRSAGSHTGALAGMSIVWRTAFRRAGITVIENPDELFPAAETLASQPPIRNKNVAILADGGGHATIAADLLTDLGVKIPTLNENTREQLRAILPPAASVQNPVDVAGGTDSDPTLFADCADILLKDPEIGGLLIVGLFGGYGIRFAESLTLMEEDAAHRMGKLLKKRKKPIILHSLYGSEKTHPLELLKYYGISVYDSLNVACKCVGVLADYGNYLSSYHAVTNFVFNWGEKAKPKGVNIIRLAKSEGRNVLLEREAKELLETQGVKILREYVVKTPDEAVAHAKEIGGHVVLKIVSPDILHKSDAGGVRVKLGTETEIRQAFDEIIAGAKEFRPDADIRGILVAPFVEKGLEIIIGTKIDDQFGPIIMFGMGGVMVELLRDISTRVLPISNRSARKMIEDIKLFPILNGMRGGHPYDRRALEKLLTQVSDLIESYPQIQEMDLNPVIVHHKGITVADARIILKDGNLE